MLNPPGPSLYVPAEMCTCCNISLADCQQSPCCEHARYGIVPVPRSHKWPTPVSLEATLFQNTSLRRLSVPVSTKPWKLLQPLTQMILTFSRTHVPRPSHNREPDDSVVLRCVPTTCSMILLLSPPQTTRSARSSILSVVLLLHLVLKAKQPPTKSPGMLWPNSIHLPLDSPVLPSSLVRKP